MSEQDADQWEREAASLGSVHRTRWGLDPGGVKVTLELQLFTGMKGSRGGLGTEKVFDTEVVTVPFQLTLPRPPQEDPRFIAVSASAPLEQHFPIGSKLLYTEAPFNGVPTTVTGHDNGQVRTLLAPRCRLLLAPCSLLLAPCSLLLACSLLAPCSLLQRSTS